MEIEQAAILSGPYRHLFPEIIDRYWDLFPQAFRQKWDKASARRGAYEFWCIPQKARKGRLPYKTLQDMESAFVAYIQFYRTKSRRPKLSERKFALEAKRKEGDSAIREFQRELRDVRISVALWIRSDLVHVVPFAFARLGPPRRAWKEKILRLVCHHIIAKLEPYLERKYSLMALKQINKEFDDQEAAHLFGQPEDPPTS